MSTSDKPTPDAATPLTLTCRRCGKPTTWHGNPFRPFCSDRCKLIDLGAWANEDYAIPVQPAADLEDDGEA